MKSKVFFQTLIAGFIALPGFALGKEKQISPSLSRKNDPGSQVRASKPQAFHIVASKTTSIRRWDSDSHENADG